MSEELAWAAGLFDGEGSFSLHAKRADTYLYPRAQIHMTELEPLERFHSIVGLGKLYGPWNYKRGKTLWAWSTSKVREAEPVLLLLRPWLSGFRIEQAERVLRGEMSEAQIARRAAA